MQNKNRQIIFLYALAVFLIFGILYQRQQDINREPISVTGFKLNTVVKITIYDSQDESLLEEALKLCDQYETIFSRTRQESELYHLNEGELPVENGAYQISRPLAELISRGLFYSELSGGAFDISVEPLSSLWDFTSGEKVVPEQKEIEEALELVDYREISLKENTLRMGREGMKLELGGIAKGYIADKIKEFLVSKGVKSAIIDLGGNLLCVGSRPKGEPFKVGVQKPFAARNQTVAALEIEDRSVVSSGIYERYFEKDGVLYHHILNPKTGYPYDNGLVSVTIISERSVDGDGLSTTCFALGLEKGMELIDSLENVQAIFITGDGELHFSENFENEVSIIYEK